MLLLKEVSPVGCLHKGSQLKWWKGLWTHTDVTVALLGKEEQTINAHVMKLMRLMRRNPQVVIYQKWKDPEASYSPCGFSLYLTQRKGKEMGKQNYLSHYNMYVPCTLINIVVISEASGVFQRLTSQFLWLYSTDHPSAGSIKGHSFCLWPLGLLSLSPLLIPLSCWHTHSHKEITHKSLHTRKLSTCTLQSSFHFVN